MAPSSTTLPSTLSSLTNKNINLLKLLNNSIFPVKYPEDYYNQLLNSLDFTRLVFYGSDILVGAVSCKIENSDDGQQRLYIMTLGVLSPYRRLGIGTQMLKWALDLKNSHPKVKEIRLHAQINNEDAISFYRSHGFVEGAIEEGYYNKVDPSAAVLLSKTL